MGKINVLSFAVANLIAAGEVVDRPASVIKELMENAIDAGADRITVEIQNGGSVFMRVTDNGCGIEKDDLAVAVRRHATSKIHDATDLDGIITLGFRGEALAAIAAVSDLRIISRVKGQPNGAVIEVSGGDIQGVFDQGCSEGTSVIVENLFSNVPVRRKFLKKDITETAAVHSVVEKVALSKPDISFTFIADGNIKLQTAGDGKLLNTIYSLYGREFSKSLIEVNYDYEGIHIGGYTGRSDNVKSNRNGQNFFINGRLVKSKTVGAAVEQAYCSYMPQEKFPVCTLFIEINPRAVDVNVHPSKLEVKFSNEKPVFEAVYYGIKNALENNTSRPSIDPDKLTRMSYNEYRQLFGNDKKEDHKIENDIAKTKQYSFSGNRLEPRMEKSKSEPRTVKISEEPETAVQTDKDNEPLPTRFSVMEYISAQPTFVPNDPEDEEMPEKECETEPPQNAEQTPSVSKPSFDSAYPLCAEENAPVASDAYIDDVAKREQVFQQTSEEALPAYRIVGEVFNSYIIVEHGEKMLLIDKHAAHERIIFEKLKKGLEESETHSQLLMIPFEFMLTSDEVLALIEYKEEIEKIGFQFEAEKYTVRVFALPETIELSAVQDIFMTIADRVRNETGSAELTRDIIFEKALYQASCKAAIKAGREYGEEHIKWIVEKLMEIPDITFCPHGRPVAMEIKHETLNRQFKRT